MGRHPELPRTPCGPDHALAFQNLAIRHKPDYLEALCPKCKGHGAWNVMLNNAGTFRNLIQACDVCRGDGWVDTDGYDLVDDIIVVDGAPRWVLKAVDKSPVPANTGGATGDNDDASIPSPERRRA